MILSGKKIAEEVEEELKGSIASLSKRPSLAVLLVGSNPASQAYIKRKQQACERVGIHSRLISFSEKVSSDELLSEIRKLNLDPHVHGILLQLPLPSHLNRHHCIQEISPLKDVDGLHPENMGKLLLGIPGGLIPCTPLGIQTLLLRSGFSFAGKHVVIVGRSEIVGKPLAALLMQNTSTANATVTITHSKTSNLASLTRQADILIAAMGAPQWIKKEMVKQGAIICDVGINRISDPTTPSGYRLVGDVDFAEVSPLCTAITPVPFGIGPMTVAMLLRNTMQCYHHFH